jgi:hypothetical protein
MKQAKSFLAASITALLIMATMALGQDAGYGERDRGRSDRDAMTVPSGTQISVRTDEAIDSQNASEGQTFPATVLQDVTGAAGEVLIPKDSRAQLVIRELRGGSTTGSPQLVLDLNSISVNGRSYRVSTEDVTQTSKAGIGKNRRTAEMVGGGAVLGTLLGAIAGGGKGAAIGAAAGAAAGGTAQVLTKGKQVKVPAETILRFQLDRPIHLDASGY